MTEFKQFMVICYREKLYNEVYYLYIFSENGELLSGPIPYVLFNSNMEEVIEELFYTKILVKAKERNIDSVIVCVANLMDSNKYLNSLK